MGQEVVRQVEKKKKRKKCEHYVNKCIAHQFLTVV